MFKYELLSKDGKIGRKPYIVFITDQRKHTTLYKTLSYFKTRILLFSIISKITNCLPHTLVKGLNPKPSTTASAVISVSFHLA